MPTPTNSRVAIVDAFRFSLNASTGVVFDQVAKPGQFVKDGEDITFDRAFFASWIRNFAAQQNPLPGDVEHQLCYVATNGQAVPLAAKYDAMVAVEGGKAYAWHSQTGDAAPDVTGWPDGVHARRCEVTPHGRDLIENKGYGFISPTFLTESVSASGDPIGPQLLTASWVVLPFLDGMQPVTFARLSAPQTMDSGGRMQSPALAVGDRVRINALPFYGVAATVQRRAPDGMRWRVEMTEGSQRGATLDLLPTELEKMSTTATEPAPASPPAPQPPPIKMGAYDRSRPAGSYAEAERAAIDLARELHDEVGIWTHPGRTNDWYAKWFEYGSPGSGYVLIAIVSAQGIVNRSPSGSHFSQSMSALPINTPVRALSRGALVAGRVVFARGGDVFVQSGGKVLMAKRATCMALGTGNWTPTGKTEKCPLCGAETSIYRDSATGRTGLLEHQKPGYAGPCAGPEPK